jgi:hypothetical protein
MNAKIKNQLFAAWKKKYKIRIHSYSRRYRLFLNMGWRAHGETEKGEKIIGLGPTPELACKELMNRYHLDPIFN